MKLKRTRRIDTAVISQALIALGGCSGLTALSSLDQADLIEGLAPSAHNSITPAEQIPLTGEVVAAESILPPNTGVLISPEDASGLQFMREEKKLAHDLYLALYERWGLPIFKNLAGSEAVHTDSIRQLLDRFGIEDPARGNAPGVFQDVTQQQLNDDLLARGSQSLADALLVGAFVEEFDIQDLSDRIELTEEPQIERMYANLMAGSENHLRAFVQQYQARTGQAYAAQFLDESRVQGILAEAQGRGRGPRVN